MRRKGVLERERAQLRAESEPGPDPELLRERIPEVLAFIREWVRQADGDDFQLLIQALDVRAEVATDERGEVATHEVDVRVEVPMIEGFDGADFVTIEQTSA